MRTAQTLACVTTLLLPAAAATAQPRPPIPAVVLTHMNTLDARCRSAGGRPADGRYVFAQDFTGDRRLDYLVSEGDYVCAGRPGLFRQNGLAKVDIFVTDGANNARRVYAETLMAYRLLAGTPVKIQIARRGPPCGPGSTAATQCAAQLAWNGQTFGEAVGVRNDRPGATVATAQPPAPAAGPAAPGAASAPAPRLTVAADAQAKFLAQCRQDYVSRDASAARWADDQCKSDWGRVVAAGPAAEALLAVAPTPGETLSLAAIRQRATGVRWAARVSPPFIAAGALGELSASVEGSGATPTAVGVNWSATGAEIPYDVAGAMRARGANVVQMSCQKTGTGEGGRIYAVTAAGRAPFTLTVDQRTAPTGNALSYYGASVSLNGRHPPRGPASDCDF